MKSMASLPQKMYVVTRTMGFFSLGEAYGPYTRLYDAEAAQERLSKGADSRGGPWEILETSLKWLPKKEDA